MHKYLLIAAGLLVSIVLAATVFQEVGAASVKVAGPPVQVQPVATPVRFNLDTLNGITYDVPAGKRLTIQYINGRSNSQPMFLSAGTPLYEFVRDLLTTGPTGNSVSQQVTIYVGAGERVQLLGSAAEWVNEYLTNE